MALAYAHLWPIDFISSARGGVDQVSLRDGEDMLALAELDQKLWVALAMPTKGIDIDADDARRARSRQRRPDPRPRHARRDRVVEGDVREARRSADQRGLGRARRRSRTTKIVAAAKRMLDDLGKPTATSISVEDTAAINKAFAETVLNGDGIVIPTSTDDADVKHVIEDIIASVGSSVDRSGKPGVDQALADAFFAAVDERAKWIAAGRAGLAPLGELTGEAAAATVAVRAKIEDYFTRCRIAAFDAAAPPRSVARAEELAALGTRNLTATDEWLAQLPLAKIEPNARLPLATGINPAWAGRIGDVREGRGRADPRPARCAHAR